MSPAKFLALVVVIHLKSAVSTADDAATGTPISCANCTICQSACFPPPSAALPLLPPPPPPPIAEPEPLPVPVAPSNCPPTIVQCCQFLPPPPPPRNGNIYTPFYNESSSSFLKGGLVAVLGSVFGLAAIF